MKGPLVSGKPRIGKSTSDGDVDGGDFLIWQQNFGMGSAAIARSSPVPEPSSAFLFLLAIFATCSSPSQSPKMAEHERTARHDG